MNQTQELRRLFEDHGGRLTLGEILNTYMAALNEIEKESEYVKFNEKLMAAKKMCAMRTAF